jgi:hypothetical protein
MPTFIVNTAILRPRQEPMACATGAPKMLMNSGIRNVKLRSCYCCSEYGNVVFVLEAESREVVLDAFNRINVPIASIMAAEEIKQLEAMSATA